MSSAEFQELHERAEHAKENPDTKPVSLTMAILAVIVATVSLMGHRTHTDEVILQNQASDAWAFFQAKNIRKHEDQIFVDTASLLALNGSSELAKLQKQYGDEATRYNKELDELKAEAEKVQDEQRRASVKASCYDLGEVFLEIGLVITSIMLLSGRRPFWYAGIVLGAIGTLIALSSILVRYEGFYNWLHKLGA